MHRQFRTRRSQPTASRERPLTGTISVNTRTFSTLGHAFAAAHPRMSLVDLCKEMCGLPDPFAGCGYMI
jgi:hypothetical protein